MPSQILSEWQRKKGNPLSDCRKWFRLVAKQSFFFLLCLARSSLRSFSDWIGSSRMAMFFFSRLIVLVERAIAVIAAMAGIVVLLLCRCLYIYCWIITNLLRHRNEKHDFFHNQQKIENLNANARIFAYERAIHWSTRTDWKQPHNAQHQKNIWTKPLAGQQNINRKIAQKATTNVHVFVVQWN